MICSAFQASTSFLLLSHLTGFPSCILMTSFWCLICVEWLPVCYLCHFELADDWFSLCWPWLWQYSPPCLMSYLHSVHRYERHLNPIWTSLNAFIISLKAVHGRLCRTCNSYSFLDFKIPLKSSGCSLGAIASSLQEILTMVLLKSSLPCPRGIHTEIAPLVCLTQQSVLTLNQNFRCLCPA